MAVVCICRAILDNIREWSIRTDLEAGEAWLVDLGVACDHGGEGLHQYRARDDRLHIFAAVLAEPELQQFIQSMCMKSRLARFR